MNENNNQIQCMYQNIPAAAAINKVPGFDPFQFLRPAVSETTHEKVWKLDLRYMKAWFRMAKPNGRMKLKSLRITEQLAIFEAQVYMDRSDEEPFSNYIAQCTAEDAKSGDYIKEAQDAALSTALNNAGFGIQFADLTGQGMEERYGSEISAAKVQNTKPDASQTLPVQKPKQVTPAQKVTPFKPQPIQQKAVMPNAAQPKSQPMAEHSSVVQKETRLPMETPTTASVIRSTEAILPIATESLPVSAESRPVTAKSLSAAAESLPVTAESLPVAADNLPIATESLPVNENTPAQASESAYTSNTPVEEILNHMTLEDAQKVVVDVGVCKGWTMSEVADRRPPSLKYYVYGGYKGDNNILRAAAKIVLDSLEAKKAG